jgi:hypothetical protein
VLVAVTGVAVALLARGHGSRHGTIPTSRSSAGTPSTPSSSGPPAYQAPTEQQLGASVNWLFNGRNYSPRLIDAQLRALSGTGATIARSDAIWGYAEPRPPAGGLHSYDWRFDDRIAGSLAAHGLTWLPIVDYSAPWSQTVPGNLHSPPRAPSDYAAYAAALAVRYGAGGRFWRQHGELPAKPVQTLEIWNEPDNPEFWPPGPDAGRYSLLYRQARDAVARANPSVRAIIGGLTNPAHFLPAVLNADPELVGRIYGVAIHPYAGTPAGILARVRKAREVLRSLGLAAVPIYVTEFGWTTSPPGAPYYAPGQLRRAYIARTLEAMSRMGCRIAGVVVYTWMTPESDPSASQQWYGINPPGTAETEDAAAFARALSHADATRAANRRCAHA